MKYHGLGLLIWPILFLVGCHQPPAPATPVIVESYSRRFLRQKEFLHEGLALKTAREALHEAIRQNPRIDGIAVFEDLVFSDWDFHLDCATCSIQAGDWIVGLVSDGGEELTGISFSIGFDPKTRRVIRTGSADQISFDFSLSRTSNGLELTFSRAGTHHFTFAAE